MVPALLADQREPPRVTKVVLSDVVQNPLDPYIPAGRVAFTDVGLWRNHALLGECQPRPALGLGLLTSGPCLHTLQRNNPSCWIQTPYIAWIAGNYKVLPLPGDDHDRRVDNIRSARGAAEFSAGTGKLVVKRNNLNFLAPQEPR